MKESLPEQTFFAIHTAETQWPVRLAFRDVSPSPTTPLLGGHSNWHQASQALTPSASGPAPGL